MQYNPAALRSHFKPTAYQHNQRENFSQLSQRSLVCVTAVGFDLCQLLLPILHSVLTPYTGDNFHNLEDEWLWCAVVKARSHLCYCFPLYVVSYTASPSPTAKQSLVQGHTWHILNQWDLFSKSEWQHPGCTAHQTQAVSGELGYISASWRHTLYWALPCWLRNPQHLWLPYPTASTSSILFPSLEFVKVIAAPGLAAAPCWWDPLPSCDRKELLAGWLHGQTGSISIRDCSYMQEYEPGACSGLVPHHARMVPDRTPQRCYYLQTPILSLPRHRNTTGFRAFHSQVQFNPWAYAAVFLDYATSSASWFLGVQKVFSFITKLLYASQLPATRTLS